MNERVKQVVASVGTQLALSALVTTVNTVIWTTINRKMSDYFDRNKK